MRLCRFSHGRVHANSEKPGILAAGQGGYPFPARISKPPIMWTVDIPFVDPVAAAQALAHLPGLAFLDSAMHHPTLGRTSTLAADPFARFRYRDGVATVDGHPVPGTGLDALRACLAPYRIEPDPDAPGFTGGAIGYFAYDLGARLERVAAPARRAGQCDDIAFNLYDTILSIDHEAGTCRLLATGFPEREPEARQARAQARLALFAQCLSTAHPTPEPAPRPVPEPAPRPVPVPVAGPLAWRSNFSRDAYEAAVERVRDYIRAGDIYQANIAQRFEADLPAGFDAFSLYRRLRATNPATFGAYLAFEDLRIASSSPERFLKLAGRAIETRPIKGTVRRVADPAEDARLGAALQADPKERAENIMIVDLLRNDLSRICEPHSVRVPVLCGLESYASVHHLVSVVTGTLKGGMDAIDLIGATFPGGSITGAPKLRAMDIITEIEGDARELYCGAIGALGFDGSLDTSIAIRTVVMDGSTAVLQAGGGVTLLSDPAREYEETLTKAARVFQAFEPAGEGAP
ncbi:Aminodeoxychorismate synthase component 1 [Methylobacterium adhaesivum]|nr:Aminodeoxychorismate synthase component 1 [Methylobacterium adhaesivum]